MDSPLSPPSQFEQLKQIYDYAKFHIGLYATVSTVLAAAIGLAGEDFKRRYRNTFIGVFAFFLVAGIGGGLVASHIVYSPWPGEVNEMLKGFNTPTHEWVWRWNRFKWYSFAEHYAFWAGLAFGICGLLIKLRDELKPEERKAIAEALKEHARGLNASEEGVPETYPPEGVAVRVHHLRLELKTARLIESKSTVAVAEGDAAFTRGRTYTPDVESEGKFVALLRREGSAWSVSSHSVAAE